MQGVNTYMLSKKSSQSSREDKIITEHLSFNLVPELRRLIQKNLDRRIQQGESLTTTDWLQEAVVEKLQKEEPDLLKKEFYTLPEDWKEIKDKRLEQQHLYNSDALSQLKKEKSKLVVKTGLTGVLGLSAGFFNSVGFGLLALGYRPLSRLTQISRVIQTMENLLTQYSEKEIKIFPSIPISRSQPIDLLIIFPNKLIMIVSIRCRTKAERRIKYDVSNQSLYFRHDKKGLHQWSPCPLVELREYYQHLNQNQDLLKRVQLSPSDLKKYPIYKTLLLWPPVTFDAESEDFQFIFTNGKIAASPLCVPEEEKTFIISQKEFYDFLKLCKEGVIT